jgi:WD40 repeat protein
MVGHTDAIRTASWSVDGKILATGSNDGTCKVWDSSTGALLRTIDLGDEDIKSAAWGRNWVLGAIAFAMGHHSRLGAGSRVLALEAGVAQMILDRV